MFYDLVTHAPPPSHLALSPFDLYREPMAVLGVADGVEIENTVLSKRHSGSGRTVAERNIRNLDQELEDLRDTYPKALVHRVLIFDYGPSAENSIPIPDGLATIPPAEQHKRTTMKTVMCDISSLLLAEMTGMAKSFEAMSTIDSPGQSPAIQHLNGSAWSEDGTSNLSRRNSQYALPTSTRSVSATGGDRSQVRMSMPAFKASAFGSGNSTPARPSTPTKSGLVNPPTTFDDIWSGNEDERPNSRQGQGQGQGSPSRPGTAEGSRAQGQGKVSVQGFGSGGPNDKFRHKGKSRVQIVIGSLYLQAGRWGDSIRELAEGATVARSVNDHVWHGKALELLLVNLFLLGWAGIEFQVPAVLLPPQEKASSTATSAQEAESRDPNQPRWLRNLQVIIPDLLDRITSLYSRLSSENLPPLPFSESVIRSCKVLSALYVANGQLCTQSLETMVRGKTSTPLSSSSFPRFSITPTRSQIASTLFRAFPSSASELLTTTDRVVILGGIISVLSTLGLNRKKAMVLRELVSVLVGGLVEARTRGAAEAGIHPAAGLVALNPSSAEGNRSSLLQLDEGDVEQNLDAFLGLVLKTYGVVGYDPFASGRDAAPSEPDGNGNGQSLTLERIQRQSAARCFGMQNVKLNVLRACINFSEALPDFGGVLKYSSDLLRTAGSGIAPGPRRPDPSPVVAKEEQIRLITSINKTSNLTQRLGLTYLAADYWDEFLLRGVELEPVPASRTPVPHSKSILPEATTTRASQDVNPFIYNPFLKQPDQAAVEKVLVAGEPAIFRLTLQNPYEIDVEIDKISLDADGVDFTSSAENIVLGPYRTQVLRLSGTAKAPGTLRLTGATVQVRGCRERSFPIFPQPWAFEPDIKIKAIGLAAFDRQVDRQVAASSAERQPKPEQLELNVIPQQPVVSVKSCTLPQSSVMILEGERQSFSVTLQNLSPSTPVDFLLFSFRDSTQEPLQAGLNSREATSAELYEYELILAKKQALRLRNGGDKRRFIAPGQTATFEFEILGKPGLTHGLVQIDYAHLGVPYDRVDERFHTRQVSLELTVTVNASIEVPRIDILPIRGSIPGPLWARAGHGDSTPEMTADQYFLLMLDLRNAWPSNMNVRLEVEDGAVIEEHILPGNTTRVVLPLKRIYIEEPHAFIPALNPSRQRQFVVSTKISPDAERANREAFWYREKILDILKGSWKSISGAPRHGSIDLRSMRLTSRMIEALKIDEVGIEIWVQHQAGDYSDDDDNDSDEDGQQRKQRKQQQSTGRSTVVFVDEFARLGVRVTNRTEQPIYPLLRVMPALCHRPPNVALDFTRKFAFNGTLQKTLPLLRPKATVESVVGVTALCRGEFEVTASVEETRLWKPVTEEDKRRASLARPRSNTETMMDAALGAKERRIWHSRKPCHLVVKDQE